MSQFSTITSEGGLLPPDLLTRIAALDKTVPGLTPADYRLEEGQKHGEAISRSWSRLVPAWRGFRAELAKLPDQDPATSLTRDRFLQPLLQELGYGRVPTAKAIEVAGKSYAITHAWGDTPIHLLGARISLEERTAGQAGAARSSPHGLVQELLNRSELHLWALLSNGLVLRLLRDHHSLTSQAYVEVDLEALFDGERYADFVLLWLVFHQSRIEPREASKETPESHVHRCWLEQWFGLSRDEGLAALDDLRDGVVAAIEALGRGFLRHPNNQRLQEQLASGDLDRQDYYRELLRLAYRLIFLFSAEDRGVLLDPTAPEAARDRYRRFYATRRLRDLAGQSRGGPHVDQWQALRAVMNGLDDGCAALALPALGSFLWSKSALPHLDGCQLANADLLAALRALSYLERHKQRFPVSWRTVAADELGSIYESLLELHPTLDAGTGAFELVTAAGNERKKTGSYYTPTSLVDCLLDSALDPVIEAATKGKPRTEAEAALLALKVVDPACGSGHFLVAAARRLAHRLATVRTGDDEPSPRERQHAIRDIVGRCIYGVDLNEMAVELCKVALWMEAVEPGKPLSFLDAHIQQGNALIGTTPALIARGIPDDAWDPIEGDDKPTARALKKRNREARKTAAKPEQPGQSDMFAVLASPGSAGELVTAAREALSGGDDVVAEVRARKRRWETLQSSPAFTQAMRVADTWCAAFVWPKQEGALAAEAPTDDAFARLRKDPLSASAPLRRQVDQLARQYMFFHWHLAFPDVFTPRALTGDDDLLGLDGGFDCVLGNPPWERVKLQEKEFFAGKHEAIASAENASLRKKLIAKLPDSDPALWEAWVQSSRQAEGESHWLRQSGRYPLCGQGDINTYAIFAELTRTLMSERGRVGCILPSGIATDDTTKEFFGSLVTSSQLASLYHFENEDFIFPTVHHAFRFCLVTMARGLRANHQVEMVFYARQVSHLAETERRVTLTPADFLTLNPNTRTCPTFRWRRDAEINKAIYRRIPVLWRETDEANGNPWGIKFLAMLHMSGDSEAFKSREQCQAEGYQLAGNVFERQGVRRLPLYEAKMVHHFDHRFGTYEGQTEAQSKQGKCPELTDADHADPAKTPLPYYWVDETSVVERLEGRWSRSWFLGWRDICRSSDMRTVITAAIPRVAVGDTFLLMMPDATSQGFAACLLANLASLAFDYCARQKVGGTHLKYNVMKQLPALPPNALQSQAPWSASSSLRDWITPRALELSYTADDLAGFAADCGYHGPPFRWDPERRSILRAELDAAFFYLYGLDLADTAYILDAFPVLRDKETREHGEYRTRRLVLERYDALTEAIVNGISYVSPLASIGLQISVPNQPVPRPAHHVPDGDWATPAVAEDNLALFTLIEVLLAAGGPMESERVRIAAILVRNPAMALPFMDEEIQREWTRLIGQEAVRLPANVLDLSRFRKNAVDHAWSAAVQRLAGSGKLIRNRDPDLWHASADLPTSRQAWVKGRVEMLMPIVRALELSTVETRVAEFSAEVTRGATANATA
jgi:N-6 DNA Methylase